MRRQPAHGQRGAEDFPQENAFFDELPILESGRKSVAPLVGGNGDGPRGLRRHRGGGRRHDRNRRGWNHRLGRDDRRRRRYGTGLPSLPLNRLRCDLFRPSRR